MNTESNTNIKNEDVVRLSQLLKMHYDSFVEAGFDHDMAKHLTTSVLSSIVVELKNSEKQKED